MDKRIFVEKKAAFQVKSESLVRELQHNLGLSTLKSVRIVQVYDVFDLAEDLFAPAEKHMSWMNQLCKRILLTMLSLPLKACQGNLTSVQLLHRKPCFCWGVRVM